VASTVVLLRALQDRDLVTTEKGRVAVGWLIVEDLVMVLSLVLIPPLAGLLGGTALPVAEEAQVVAEVGSGIGIGPIAATVLITLAKAAAFVALMLVVGQRVVPWVLHFVAQTRSRELFRLAVLAIALGVAYGATHFFGVSFALGAFFAGMVMSSSTLSQQAMRETLPLRDAFAVLFFVSVGMLFNPSVVLASPVALVATVVVIIFVKSVAAYYIMRSFGHDHDKGLTIAASLAQIGEFSFILISMGVTLDIVPPEARDLVVAGAMISILANPLLFHLLDRRERRKAATGLATSVATETADPPPTEIRSDAPSAVSATLPSAPPPGE
jgi:monovalent cation:H+ antiporter-2, CPA2 family